jgi:hypothetical protein
LAAGIDIPEEILSKQVFERSVDHNRGKAYAVHR